MLFSHLLSLVLSLSVLRCASFEGGESKVDATEENTIEIQEQGPVTDRFFYSQEKSPLLSANFTDDLFLKIFEYVAKSPGKMSMTCKRIKEVVKRTKRIRFYEGAGWSIPELLNVCNFGILTAGDSEEVVNELKIITSLALETDEQTYTQKMNIFLIRHSAFQKLAGPVLRYLVRAYFNDHRRNVNYHTCEYLSRLYVFAAKSGFYDVIFEIKKHIKLPEYGNYIGHILIDDSFYFNYFNWVYDNPRALKYVVEQISESKLCHLDIEAWTAVCIVRGAPENFYIEHIIRHISTNISVFIKYFVKFNLINVDVDETRRHHGLIISLIDRYCLIDSYLRESNRHHLYKNLISFLKLLNDVRYGPEDSELYQDRITAIIEKRDFQNMSMLILTASKANKKELIRNLLNHPRFDFGHLSFYTEFKNPHNFKVYFDIHEANPQVFSNGWILEKSITAMISSIINSKLKITSAISLTNGIKFKIESPKEYVDLGFSENYEFVLLPKEGHLRKELIFDLQKKMIEDAADAGPIEFKDFITRHFADHTHVDHNLIMGFTSFRVSFKVIQSLLDNAELITMLRNRHVQLYCKDFRISDEMIAGYRDVIIYDGLVINP